MMSVNNSEQMQGEQKLVFSEPVRPLTRQELHVLECLGQGYTNEDIGRTLNIAISTVSSHVQHILKKLQVRNRVEAVLYMKYRKGLLEGVRAPQPVVTLKKPENRTAVPSLCDPLLFLSQLNHVNWYIAVYGPVHIDYFGIAGDVLTVFYDSCTRQLNAHLSVYNITRSEGINVEIDECLWKYILEMVERAANKPLTSSGSSQIFSPLVPDG